MSPEEMLDRARSLDEERLAHDKESKRLKAEVDDLSARIMASMHLCGLDQLNGARIVKKEKAFISNWVELDAYIREHDATDLLQKRLTESAVKLRWDDGIQVPGVGRVVEEKLQL